MGRAVRLQPGRGGFSRTTKYQLFEQVDRWLARVGKGRQGGAAVVVAGGGAGVHGAEGVRRPRRSTSWLRSRSYAAAEVLCAAAPTAAAVGAKSAWTLVLKQSERAGPHRLNAYPLFAQSYQAFFN